MTEPTPAHVEPSPREELRVQLLLSLPAIGCTDDDDPAGGQDLQVDPDYDPTALAAWILERFDRIERDATERSLAGIEEIEAAQAEMIELATAGATFSAMAEWARFLGQMPAVLRRGLSIKDAHDLAASLDQEHQRVLAVLAALADRFPALRALLGDSIGARARGLETAAGTPLEL